MRRREFLALTAGSAAGPLLAQASGACAQGTRRFVVGFLGVTSQAATEATLLPALRRGLEETGFIEGRNVTVAYAWAEGRYDRLPALAAARVERRVDVLVAAGGIVTALAARDATKAIPTLILAADDPVRHGLAASINRPGGNITGVVQLVLAAEAKRLEMLREILPSATAIAFLTNRSSPTVERAASNARAAAAALGLRLDVLAAGDEAELDAAVSGAARAGADALMVAGDPYFLMRRERIVALAARHALPAIYFFREFAMAGGLVSFGSNLTDAYYQTGLYAGRILKGANPAEMPMIQQTDKLELVLNLPVARTLGLAIPPALLARADEVIE